MRQSLDSYGHVTARPFELFHAKMPVHHPKKKKKNQRSNHLALLAVKAQRENNGEKFAWL